MRNVLLSLSIVLLVLGVGYAAEPESQTVQMEPVTENWDGVGLRSFGVRIDDFGPAPQDCGTVGRQALVGSSDPGGGRGMWVAIDATEPGSASADVLRLDFSGKCRFKDAVTLPLVPSSADPARSPPRFSIEAELVRFERNGNPGAALVQGSYYHGSDRSFLYLRIKMALEGRGKFGDKVLPIRIYDSSLQNGMLADVPDVPWRGVTNRNLERGDRVVIDAGGRGWGAGGSKAIHDSFATAYYGSPICVHGKWYDLALWEDTNELEIRPSSVPIGYLQADHFNWNATLVGTKYCLRLSWADEKPIAVPADTYVVVGYAEMSPKLEPDGKEFTLYFGHEDLRDRDFAIECRPGKTTQLVVGSPITVAISATPHDGVVEFFTRGRDAAGRKVSIRVPERGDPVPTVRVTDSTGATVLHQQLESRHTEDVWGEWGYTWQVPRDLHGTFTVTPEIVVRGFPHTIQETTFTIEPGFGSAVPQTRERIESF